jgi:hypothetical protein
LGVGEHAEARPGHVLRGLSDCSTECFRLAQRASTSSTPTKKSTSSSVPWRGLTDLGVDHGMGHGALLRVVSDRVVAATTIGAPRNRQVRPDFAIRALVGLTRRLLPCEVPGVDRMGDAVRERVIEVRVVRPRHEVVMLARDDLRRRRDRREQIAQRLVLLGVRTRVVP